MELMAPVGDRASLEAALGAGCDSVYFGAGQLNMRARATSNFDLDELAGVVAHCREAGVRSYLTLNTLLYDHDLALADALLDAAREAGLSAVICADVAAIQKARARDLPVHVSTQLSVSNLEAVRFYAAWADVIVLARELTLPMVARLTRAIAREEIRGPSGELVGIEVFGHGALCVAVSGRCSMSLLTENSSGNRGACKQNCRREYRITDPETEQELLVGDHYVLSPMDLCTIGMLDQVVAAGVRVLKIEGRGRSPDYVDRVVRTYRSALDALEAGEYTAERIEAWNRDLGTVFHRGLGSESFRGRSFREWSGMDGNQASTRREYVGRVENFYRRISVLQLTVEDHPLRASDRYQVIGETTGILRGANPRLRLEEETLEVAERGQQVTFEVPGRVRPGDRVYRVVDRREGPAGGRDV